MALPLYLAMTQTEITEKNLPEMSIQQNGIYPKGRAQLQKRDLYEMPPKKAGRT